MNNQWRVVRGLSKQLMGVLRTWQAVLASTQSPLCVNTAAHCYFRQHVALSQQAVLQAAVQGCCTSHIISSRVSPVGSLQEVRMHCRRVKLPQAVC